MFLWRAESLVRPLRKLRLCISTLRGICGHCFIEIIYLLFNSSDVFFTLLRLGILCRRWLARAVLLKIAYVEMQIVQIVLKSLPLLLNTRVRKQGCHLKPDDFARLIPFF